MKGTNIPSQPAHQSDTPVPYTGDPLRLCWADALLFMKSAWSIVGVLYPINQWLCGPLDELYPSSQNLICLLSHLSLIVLQITFLASLPFTLVLPLWTSILYLMVVMSVIFGVCFFLNGNEDSLRSKVDLGVDGDKYPHEAWLFVNGVSVGKHWLQNNLDRLALTFRRPITGVHNRTYGIIFDLIQCIIERNFNYATFDTRNAYALIRASLVSEKHKKVVLILHSQGGIEGSLILDWLLSELSHDAVGKLEIYTFGSAANHFNNPHRTATTFHSSPQAIKGVDSQRQQIDKAVHHIEHYANDGDFVARWGVLSFTRLRSRYMGRVFIRSGTGHLLNQHYLNAMFPLDPQTKRVIEDNEFMQRPVEFSDEGAGARARARILGTLLNGGDGTSAAIVEDVNFRVEPVSVRRAESLLAAELEGKAPKVRAFSRLWEYRNGGSPQAQSTR